MDIDINIDYGWNPCAQIDYDAAHHRAIKLLRSHLTPCQRHSYDLYHYFFVRAKDGGIYLLNEGSEAVRFTEGRPRHTFGFSCTGRLLPMADRLLAQKLLLEAAPDHLWNEVIPCRYRASATYDCLPGMPVTLENFKRECAEPYCENSVFPRLFERIRKVHKYAIQAGQTTGN